MVFITDVLKQCHNTILSLCCRRILSETLNKKTKLNGMVSKGYKIMLFTIKNTDKNFINGYLK